MAVQIAKAAGAKVMASASIEEKLAVAQRFGIDYCLNHSESDDW